jgi:hypothetical protein
VTNTASCAGFRRRRRSGQGELIFPIAAELRVIGCDEHGARLDRFPLIDSDFA